MAAHHRGASVDTTKTDTQHAWLQHTAFVENSWTAHELEAWVIRTHLVDPAVLFTGGDDAAFKWCVSLRHALALVRFGRLLCAVHSRCYAVSWDTRTAGACVFQQKKAHAAGVCAIECNPHRDCELATGAGLLRLMLCVPDVAVSWFAGAC